MRYLIFLFIISLTATQCTSSTAPEDSSLIETDNFVIQNDENELNERVTDPETEVLIDSTTSELNIKRKEPKFTLRLKSEVSPPVVNGQSVQTTMVTSDGSSRTVIAYNMSGEPYIGAIDIAQITGSGNIRIRSNLSVSSTDVNAISYDNNRIYAATATADMDFRNPESASSLQSYSVDGFTFSGEAIKHQSLNSFVANSVKLFNGNVFITTGNTGSLFVFDSELSEKKAEVSIPEARWVDANDDYIVVLAGDTDGNRQGTIYIIDTETFAISRQYSFEGAYTPEAKNTVELKNHLAFIAAGKGGLKVMDLSSGQILFTQNIPDPASLGLSADVVATNAVSVDEELVFISNGEAGFYVAEADKQIDSYVPGEQLSLTMLGRLAFDDLESANHVSYKDRIVTVAAGRGGVKSIEVRYKSKELN